jgi:hypothetical protein
VKGGRTVDDFINVRDFAPTFLEAAGVSAPVTVTGRSFLKSLAADASGNIDPSRDVMLMGKERHDLGRPNDAGYPVRAIRTREWLYVRNFEPDRWPAGNPETGYRNVDDSPSKTFLISGFDEYYRMSFGKRPAEELYDIRRDPDCVDNLARNVELNQSRGPCAIACSRCSKKKGTRGYSDGRISSTPFSITAREGTRGRRGRKIKIPDSRLPPRQREPASPLSGASRHKLHAAGVVRPGLASRGLHQFLRSPDHVRFGPGEVRLFCRVGAQIIEFHRRIRRNTHSLPVAYPDRLRETVVAQFARLLIVRVVLPVEVLVLPLLSTRKCTQDRDTVQS